MESNLSKLLTEFIGTFFFVLTIGCVILMGGPNVIAPLAIGFALMIMVYAGGSVSGGHYNPSVSFAALLSGALTFGNFIKYIITQFLGGIVAVFTVLQISNVHTAHTVFAKIPLFTGEVLFTFALCFVVLMTAVYPKTSGNSYFGLAIGSTVMVGAFAVGSICFAAFNPAVILSVGMLGLASWKFVVLTMVANITGSILAALAYSFIQK